MSLKPGTIIKRLKRTTNRFTQGYEYVVFSDGTIRDDIGACRKPYMGELVGQYYWTIVDEPGNTISDKLIDEIDASLYHKNRKHRLDCNNHNSDDLTTVTYDSDAIISAEYSIKDFLQKELEMRKAETEQFLNDKIQSNIKKVTQMKIKKNVTLIDGHDASTFGADELLNKIRNEEKRIEELDKIKATSKHVERKKKMHEANIKALVEILDQIEA